MTSVIKAQLNFENLEFSSVFKPLECTDIAKQVEILDILMVIKQVVDWFG